MLPSVQRAPWPARFRGTYVVLIKNRKDLTAQGDSEGRDMALDILEAGLAVADPYVNTRRLIRIEGDTLRVGGHPEMDVSGFGDEVIDLSAVESIYVLGAGKAVQRQAKALEDLLGDRLTAGAITIKRGEAREVTRIEVTEAAHPLPDDGAVAGTQKIVALAQAAGPRDLVFTLFSDGASALSSAYPLPGITLQDVRALYKLAIKYGSQGIIVRPMGYFSQVSRGRLMQLIHPARSINLVMQVGLFPRWNGVLPTTASFVPSWPPGRRSMDQDVQLFQAQPWWQELPAAMRGVLERRDPAYDVPDLDEFRAMRCSFWQPIDLYRMVNGARVKAEALGLRGVTLAAHLTATAAHAANVLAQIAHECEVYGRPFTPPVALITGGHLDVPTGEATGVGGRNQEFALTWGRLLGSGRLASNRVVVAAIDSDGTDGPGTQLVGGEHLCMAGGVVDGSTMAAAERLGVDVTAELKNHNSTMALLKLKSAIYTGNTGTCLGDLRVAIVR
jgi:glycerate 2-kinase